MPRFVGLSIRTVRRLAGLAVAALVLCGYGPIGRLIHGSTSRMLTHMARWPLLVLPRSTRVIAASGAEVPGRRPEVAVKG